MNQTADRVLRAMTDDGSFRVLVARTTDTARRIAELQQVQGVSASCLGEVITASVLVRETMAPGNRVQVLFTDKIGTRLVGDANPEGATRGLAQVADEVLGVLPGDGGILQVVRIVRPGQPHQGYVETDDEGGVSGALRTYFLQSEQVETRLALAAPTADDDAIAMSVGFVVQLLPEVTEPPLARMEARIDALGDLSAFVRQNGDDPEALLAALMGDVEYTRLAESGVAFVCGCGRERAIGAASTLGADELRELIESGEELTITCDYCRTRYSVGPDDYRLILDQLGDA